MKKKVALITGITGQDGSYLAELLVEKGYEVHGMVRRSSSFNRGRVEHLYKYRNVDDTQITLHYGDLGDGSSIIRLIQLIKPDEIYNLAAQSHVKISFDIPEYTADVTGVGTVRLLEAIRVVDPKIKFYQASSSELYGKVVETPQNEMTPFYPRSPYAVAKLYSFWITKNYREAYGMYTVNGILFNHESPRRGKNFVTRKISHGLSEVKLGLRDKIELGNMDARRDWGFARDYVVAMWLMMQHETSDDYVVSTGEMHTVREFVEEVCKCLDISIKWEGEGLHEVGIDTATGNTIVSVNPKFFRDAEVDILLGDSSKAKALLGWEADTKFEELARIMVESDLEMIQNKDNRF